MHPITGVVDSGDAPYGIVVFAGSVIGMSLLVSILAYVLYARQEFGQCRRTKHALNGRYYDIGMLILGRMREIPCSTPFRPPLPSLAGWERHSIPSSRCRYTMLYCY